MTVRGRIRVAYAVPTGVYVRSRLVGQGWTPPQQLGAGGFDPFFTGLALRQSPSGGTAVVAWQPEENSPIVGGRLDPGRWDPAVRLSPRAPAFATAWDLAVDGAGDTIIAWARPDQSVAVAHWPRDQAVQPPLTVANAPRARAFTSDVAVDANHAGDAVVAWRRDDRGPVGCRRCTAPAPGDGVRITR